MKYHFIFLTFVLACSITQLDAQEEQSKSEKAFSKIDFKEGSRLATLINEYGKKWKIRVDFPELKKEKNTLIIALHWAGGGDTFKEFHDCLAVPGLVNLNAIIVSPEGENQIWSTSNNEEKVLSIITNAKKYWNIDSDKIVIMGYSNGGNGSWYFAEKYPELFSAAIPMASAYQIKQKIDIPLYVIHGKKDALFDITRTEKWVTATKEKGTDLTFVVEDQLSHFEACNYVDALKKAGEWLQNKWKEQ